MLNKIPRLFFLNLLWLLMSLPVITAGGSTCAAFAVALRIADDDEEVKSFRGISRRFFKAFKQDFLQGILIFIFSLVSFGLGGYFVYLAWDSSFNLLKIGLLVIYFFIVLVLNLYSYPLIARYSNSFINVLRNSIGLFLQYLNMSFKTIGLVILELAVLALTYKIYFAGLLILPAVIFYTISRTAKDIFVKLEKPAPAEE